MPPSIFPSAWYNPTAVPRAMPASSTPCCAAARAKARCWWRKSPRNRWTCRPGCSRAGARITARRPQGTWPSRSATSRRSISPSSPTLRNGRAGCTAAQLAQAGAHVTAIDRSPARVARLRENLSRLSLQAETVVADAVEWAGPTDGFDGILIDAPCTSTGTIRRHPDVSWLRQESDIAAMTTLQQRLLRKSVSLLKPGGTLVYCTCSLEPEEGEHGVAALLAAEPALRRVPIEASEVSGLSEIITIDGDLRTLPSHLPHADPKLGGLDGFFAARLVKS